MTIDAGLFYLIILVSLVHSALVIVLDILYLRQTRRLNDLKKESEKSSASANERVNQILEEARIKSRSLVMEATNSASRIINEAKVFTSAAEETVNKVLLKATDEYEIRFKDILSRALSESEKLLIESTRVVKKPLLVELEAFSDSFQKELAQIRQENRIQMASLQKQTAEEINWYKEQKLKELENVILQLVQDITREIVGSEINPEKHQELVLKALEEAKRQNIF